MPDPAAPQEAGADRPGEVSVKRNEHGTWCVYIDGGFVSDHATYDGAAAAANNHLRIAVTW